MHKVIFSSRKLLLYSNNDEMTSTFFDFDFLCPVKEKWEGAKGWG